jgi:hemerythrin-like metal-binding protein
MEQFIWRDSYSVQNEELDSHHRRLIAIFNKLYDSFLANAAGDAIELTINELISYTNYHFEAEENYMTDRSYADIEAHKSLHAFFIEKMTHLHHRNSMHDAGVAKELVVYLGNWLINHVLQEDRKYSR